MSDDKQDLKGKKVFIVEDDVFFANMISDKVIREGGVLIHAPTGEEAVAMVPQNVPDIVVLDLLLPGKIDGFKVLEILKADPALKDIPVIIVSNLSQPEDIDRGMRLGAFHYLVKASVTPAEIIEQLANTLKSGVRMS